MVISIKLEEKGTSSVPFQLDISDTGDHNSDRKGTALDTPPSSHHLSLLFPFNFSLKQISSITYFFFALVSHSFHWVFGALESLKQKVTDRLLKMKEKKSLVSWCFVCRSSSFLLLL